MSFDSVTENFIFPKVLSAICPGPNSCNILMLLHNFYFPTVFVTVGCDLNCQPGDLMYFCRIIGNSCLSIPACTQNHGLPLPHCRFTPIAANCDRKFWW